jgi:hypothetical protein
MKNNISLLVIYTKKTLFQVCTKMGRKIKVQFKINKVVFTDSVIKEMCVQKAFCRTLNTTGIEHTTTIHGEPSA